VIDSARGDRVESRAAAVGRLRWVLLVGAAMWLVVFGRLVQVQGIDHVHYSQRARAQHERQEVLSARRGDILDRSGRELALDVASVSFYAHPAALQDRIGAARHFARVSGRSAQDLARQLDSDRPFVYLMRQARDEELERARSEQFQGVLEQKEVRRLYPYGHLAGQLLGFTSIDNEGREGVELALDELLAEQPGAAKSYVDNRGRFLPDRSQATEPARHGASVRLTIDAVMQTILEEELSRAVADSEAESALGIISDPRTGDILALGSVPLFDPNHPGSSPAADRRNRLITDPFEPGSTLKPITMAAVLDGRHASKDTIVFCEQGAMELATGDTLRDTKPHGWLTASEVMSNSSNIGMVKMARTLKRGEFYESLRSFGFGTRTGMGLPAESAGLLRQARDWSERSLATIAIGQEISVTAVQLLQAFGAIANGGLLMAPRLLAQVRGADGGLLRETGPQQVRRVVSEETAAVLQEMLREVVRSGTGRNAAIEGVDVAGKTGTAQRALPGGGGYADDEYVASFVGFVQAPRGVQYMGLVVVENPRVGKYGGTVAAPAFRRAMERILALDGPPSVAVLAAQDSTAPDQVEAIPDLRGLQVSSARVQAARRGLVLRLEGEGQLVVSQDPAPHVDRGSSTVVACRLGEADDVPPPVTLRGTPLRQAVLIRKLGMRRQLVALAP
jgi:cell division protein FtsI (penicillin-binding protein 3)